MSKKIAACALALAVLAGSAAGFSAVQTPQVISAAAAEQPVSVTKAANGIPGPTVDAGTYKIKSGETFKIRIKVTDNKDGFNALNTWLDINTNYFEIVKTEAGDPDGADYEDSEAYSSVSLNTFSKKNAAKEIKTIISLYSDTNNYTGDIILSTITLKAKADAPEGYYTLPFDAVAEDGAMGNRIITKDGNREPLVINPTFKGALVQIGDGTEIQPASSSSAKGTLKGDVNLDGKVTQLDATYLLRETLSLSVDGKSILDDFITEEGKKKYPDNYIEISHINGDVDNSDNGASFRQTDATFILRALLEASVAGKTEISDETWSQFSK